MFPVSKKIFIAIVIEYSPSIIFNFQLNIKQPDLVHNIYDHSRTQIFGTAKSDHTLGTANCFPQYTAGTAKMAESSTEPTDGVTVPSN